MWFHSLPLALELIWRTRRGIAAFVICICEPALALSNLDMENRTSPDRGFDHYIRNHISDQLISSPRILALCCRHMGVDMPLECLETEMRYCGLLSAKSYSCWGVPNKVVVDYIWAWLGGCFHGNGLLCQILGECTVRTHLGRTSLTSLLSQPGTEYVQCMKMGDMAFLYQIAGFVSMDQLVFRLHLFHA